mgnify:FL=1|tara:strand:+ start:494 stop:1120 length:627 start_codon:yes stop_codon:yes gene_type:complete
MDLKNTSTFAALIFAMGLVAAPAMATEADLDNDGVPNTAEPLLKADPMNADTDGDGMNDLADDNPIFAANTIATDGAATPFTFGETLVENNFDYALNKDASDHLEIQVLNSGNADLTGFSIYYTVKDLDAGTTEAYLKTLDGFTVPAGADARIHLDTGEQAGHFRDNPNGSYATSQAAKLLTVTLKADGFVPLTTEISKDAGGAEAAD